VGSCLLIFYRTLLVTVVAITITMQVASSSRVASRANAFSAKGVAARPSRKQLTVQNAVKEVFMPALSSTMTEGKIVSWLKQVGDKVNKGEPIVVVESDKADMDVESFSEGILAAVVINEGERADVGAAIAFVAESEADVEAAKKKAAAMGGAAPAAAAPAAPAPAAAAPPPPPPAPAAAAPAPAPAAAAPAPPAPAAAAPAPRADGRVIATPYAKQLAKELRVDLATVGGTGPNGRVTASDVERAAGRGEQRYSCSDASTASASAVRTYPRGDVLELHQLALLLGT
jgi:pyruvate dehydrogenase E2 component (dihydrolipoamide acetyltransferase)